MESVRFTHAATHLAVGLLAPLGALALERGASAQTSPPSRPRRRGRGTRQHAAEERQGASPLVRTVRDVTQRYQNVAAAEADGYALMFGCVSGPGLGRDGPALRQPRARARR